MTNRDQIAKNMMFATANLINNKDESRVPELTASYWEAAVAFNDEFCDDQTAIDLAEKTITDFVNQIQTV